VLKLKKHGKARRGRKVGLSDRPSTFAAKKRAGGRLLTGGVVLTQRVALTARYNHGACCCQARRKRPASAPCRSPTPQRRRRATPAYSGAQAQAQRKTPLWGGGPAASFSYSPSGGAQGGQGAGAPAAPPLEAPRIVPGALPYFSKRRGRAGRSPGDSFAGGDIPTDIR